MEHVTFIDPNGKSLALRGVENHEFHFDSVMNLDASQKEVYEAIAKPVLEDVMKGYNGTIFAYGQTGSGKTFTMQGPDIENQELKGIIPRIVEAIFLKVEDAPETVEFTVRASLVEIYMEKIRDLFNTSKVDLKVREDKARGIYLDGVEEIYISCPEEALELLKMGQSHRATNATKMNAESSRSHCVFMLTLVQKNNADGSTKTSKIFLVDLAGSEKVRKTGAEGLVFEEAKTINKSLSALGNVINSLTDGKSTHVPYRDSKLTRILQESLGGNSRTALVINVSPASDNEMESLSTCRFGARAKSVKNHAKVNQERSAAELKLLLAKAEKEIERQRLVILAMEEEIDTYRAGGEPPPRKLSATRLADEEEALDAHTDLPDLPDLSSGGAPRIRAHSSTFELELKAMETQAQLKEEELVLLQDRTDELTEQLEDKQLEAEHLASELARHRDRTRDLEEDARNLSCELEASRYKFEEVAAELEAAIAQNHVLRNQVTELQDKVMEPAPSDLTQQVTQLIPELREQGAASQPVASPEVHRRRTPSIMAAEEAMAALAAAEGGGLSPEAQLPSTPEAALRANQVAAAADAALVSSSEPPTTGSSKADDHVTVDTIVPLAVDLDAVAASTDTEYLKGLVTDQNEKMLELAASRNALATRQTTLEQECSALKARSVKDHSDYQKWKALVLVDLRARIDRIIRLEISLDETKERYESLLKNSHDPSRKRLHFLEQSVQCLTKKCQETQKQLDAYAAENKVNDTKIQRKNERIKILELLLNDARDRNEKLRAELHQARGTDPGASSTSDLGMMPPPTSPEEVEADYSAKTPTTLLAASKSPQRIAERLANVSASGKVVKPIRGGHKFVGVVPGGDDETGPDGNAMSSFAKWVKRVVGTEK